ncbi:MAG: hypothetical protein J6D02_09030 [Lachnospira sp.]|nr:hypothetical protein [Lachnospira sp.]
MVIESSNVAMGSKRVYESRSKDSVSASNWNRAYSGATSQYGMGNAYAASSSYQQVELYQNYSAKGHFLTDGVDVLNRVDERADVLGKLPEEPKAKPDEIVRENTAKYVIQNVLELRQMRMISLTNLLHRLIQGRRSVIDDLLRLNREGFSSSQVITTVQKMEITHSYEEAEATAFASKGTVKTADGRSISFNVDVAMSRYFKEEHYDTFETKSVTLVDPLVINLDCDSVQVRDQKFLFDLDGDGTLDNVSMLSQMCGYLALDRNGDGRINDGSELFGAMSGDGFAELAVFDSDGNGWIDENDEIFDKLRIWTKDEYGNDHLVGLGVRGIGAIYLGNVATRFSLTNSKNEVQGVVRQSGVFLKENGEVGTVQQVDMASGY